MLPMSSATFIASDDAPERPLLVNPAAYNPALPFHPFGNGAFGNPLLEKKSLSFSHEGTLLRYPVARTTESISRVSPLASWTLPLENLLIPAGTTLILPDLILPNVPRSRTGVFPSVFLSSRGPTAGLLRPYFSVSPRMSFARKRSILSTTWRGNHFSSDIANSNVDLPRTSFGKT
uniref:Uncharacterized protein n=1 Tax=Opuntia streptacantha TaxID=393608 RepID=A0A7C8YUE9_OPUST